ncbi:MAG: oligogalacturonate lyase family protein [Christensenellales bacterium]
MAIGDVYKSKPASFVDPNTGYTIIQPIDEDQNRHMYFTSNPFTSNGDEIIFSAIRNGHENYYVLNFHTGEYIQLTDLKGIATAHAYYDKAGDFLYYGDGRKVWRVGVHSLKTELICQSEDKLGTIAITCDGKYMISFTQTSMSFTNNDKEVLQVPIWRIFRLDLATGEETTIMYRNARIDHIQCHPTDPEWFMYCLWGYYCTHQRVWRANIFGTDGGPVGNEKPNEHRTHEYYTNDGKHIACHGKFFSYGDKPKFKNIRHTWIISEPDGKNERVYTCLPKGAQAGHSIQSHDGSMVAADGNDFVTLLDFDNDDMTCTFRPVATHSSTMSGNFVHPHPSFSLDDRYIVFATDMGGKDRGNIYLVDLHSKNG